VLDPNVVLRADGGTARARQTVAIHGARAVAAQALTFTRLAPFVRPALINGTAGVIVAVDVLSDPRRVADLDLAVFDDSP
jgi:RNA polymerase sigma-70 factor, ECF subfamily